MDKKGIYKRILLGLIVCFAIVGVASFVSHKAFGVANPFASGIGLFRVTFTDATFVEVQDSPKVIFFKKDYGIVKAMEEHDYDFLEEEQLGSMLVFEKDGVKYRGLQNGGWISFFRAEKAE